MSALRGAAEPARRAGGASRAPGEGSEGVPAAPAAPTAGRGMDAPLARCAPPGPSAPQVASLGSRSAGGTGKPAPGRAPRLQPGGRTGRARPLGAPSAGPPRRGSQARRSAARSRPRRPARIRSRHAGRQVAGARRTAGATGPHRSARRPGRPYRGLSASAASGRLKCAAAVHSTRCTQLHFSPEPTCLPQADCCDGDGAHEPQVWFLPRAHSTLAGQASHGPELHPAAIP